MSRGRTNPVALRLGLANNWKNSLKSNADYRESFRLNLFFTRLVQGFVESRKWRRSFLNRAHLALRVRKRLPKSPLKPITHFSRAIKKVTLAGGGYAGARHFLQRLHLNVRRKVQLWHSPRSIVTVPWLLYSRWSDLKQRQVRGWALGGFFQSRTRAASALGHLSWANTRSVENYNDYLWGRLRWKRTLRRVRYRRKLQTFRVRGCQVTVHENTFRIVLDYTYTHPWLHRDALLNRQWAATAQERFMYQEYLRAGQLSVRLKLLQITTFFEALVRELLGVESRLVLRNSYQLGGLQPLSWWAEKRRHNLVPHQGWRNYLNYIYIATTCNIALSVNSSRLIAELMGYELEKTRRHTRFAMLMVTVLRNILTVREVLFRRYREAEGWSWFHRLRHAASGRVAGVKLFIKGCFNRRKRTSLLRYALGQDFSFQRFELKCDSAFAEAYNRRGSFGIRVFIFYL